MGWLRRVLGMGEADTAAPPRRDVGGTSALPTPPKSVAPDKSSAARSASAAERRRIARLILEAEDAGANFWEEGSRIAKENGLSIFDVTDHYLRLKDERDGADEPPVKVATFDRAGKEVLDLREVDSTRMRIVGSANWVTNEERAVYGGQEYLLVREPDNEHDGSAVAVYGKGRKIGYLSAARAASIAPQLDELSADAYTVGGTTVLGGTVRLWVNVPRTPALRAYVQTRR